MLLQWGRGQLTAERITYLVDATENLNASMGPRSADRGKHESPVTSPAKMSLQWGRGQLTAERTAWAVVSACEFHASMGPRSADRGKRTFDSCRSRFTVGFNGAAVS